MHTIYNREVIFLGKGYVIYICYKSEVIKLQNRVTNVISLTLLSLNQQMPSRNRRRGRLIIYVLSLKNFKWQHVNNLKSLISSHEQEENVRGNVQNQIMCALEWMMLAITIIMIVRAWVLNVMNRIFPPSIPCLWIFTA